MEDIIIYIIVAFAVLYLGRWIFKNVVVHEDTETPCSSCDSCESKANIPPNTASNSIKT